VQQQSGTNLWLISPFFINANTGWIAGVSGKIVKTTNGGNCWVSQNSSTTNEFRSNFFLNPSTGFTVGFYGTVVKTITGGSRCPCTNSPINGMPNVSPMANLGWENDSGMTNYTVQVSAYQDFNSFEDTANVSTNSYTVPNGKLQFFTTYYWRVRGNSSAGPTDWSDVWSFTTGNFIGINSNNSASPKEFKLYSNYPNPFNPSTKIKFDVPQTALTQIVVYDELGRTITTLANSMYKAGQYEIEWNADKLNSGVYFLKMVSDKYIETRRMVLIK